jgi:integrase
VAKIISKIGTREQRKKLKPSGKPYFEDLEKGLDFGYRKGKRERKWVVRRLIVGARKYTVETIGMADDFADADGAKVLTYHQARDKARAIVQGLAEETRIVSLGPVLTVASAVEPYSAKRDAREQARAVEGPDGALRGLKRDARSRLRKHVLSDPVLSAKPLASLTSDDLAEWRKRLQVSAPQRVVNDLKAALNSGVSSIKAPEVRQAIRDAIKEGLKAVDAAPANARKKQVLPDPDVRRLISAAWEVDAEGDWGGDLARLVLVLAATGARFSQIIRMTVADVQNREKRLMIPASRKGKAAEERPPIGVRVGDDILDALGPATAGRKGHEPLLLRPHWRQIGPAKWETGERGPWYAASELTERQWPKIVRRAELAAATIPYALRHSSIVRGLRAALPTQLVAKLHDTSVAMIEKHYAAFIVDAMDELAALAVVPLTTAPATVHSIDERASA